MNKAAHTVRLPAKSCLSFVGAKSSGATLERFLGLVPRPLGLDVTFDSLTLAEQAARTVESKGRQVESPAHTLLTIVFSYQNEEDAAKMRAVFEAAVEHSAVPADVFAHTLARAEEAFTAKPGSLTVEQMFPADPASRAPKRGSTEGK